MTRLQRIRAALKKPRCDGHIIGADGRNVGELGVGTNDRARLSGIVLEDEKVYGTCHFAVGSNYDNDAEALIHLDGLVKSPDITVIERSGKEKLLMENGRLAWD